MRACRVFVLLFVLPPLLAFAQEPVDLDMVNRIRDEGLHRSEVMETTANLTDVIGPRLTGSPSLKQANEWTIAKLEEWGLENAHLEGWEFGRGWSFDRSAVHMIEPRRTPLLALPKAWTPGTEQPVQGLVMKVKLESEEDLEKHRGKLAGKILFLSDPRTIKEADRPFFRRYSEDDLDDMSKFAIPRDRPDEYRQQAMKRWQLSKKLNDFLVEEKVVATVEVSSRDNALVRVSGGGSREVGENPGVPALVMASEHYNLILRLLDKQKRAVKIEIDLMEVFPRKDWTLLGHALIWHGRRVCSARKPDCENCTLAGSCPSAFCFDHHQSEPRGSVAKAASPRRKADSEIKRKS